MKPTFSIIIPTFNNAEYLNPCISSICQTGVLSGLGELIIVNNGSQPIEDVVRGWPNTKVLKAPSNLGWERGLEFGLKEAQGDFICFQNDDTFIPKACAGFYSQLLFPFHDSSVAAVGPATTIAAGWHSVFRPDAFRWMAEVTFLIFFTVMLRRSDLEAAGGIDTSAPGGDDLDLSIRLRNMGKRLLVNPDAFLIHHAFKTGTRVRGEASVSGGWNSKEMTDRTNQWLIQKHGFRKYLETYRGMSYQLPQGKDLEGDVVRSLVRGPRIIELGCGGIKTVPQAIGVDRVPHGTLPTHLMDPSVADVEADVTQILPFDEGSVDCIIARHILEHCVDLVETIANWKKVLKDGGRLIIAVPNQDIRNTIPLNPEHVHGFTPSSLERLMVQAGFMPGEYIDPGNGISFVSAFTKTSQKIFLESSSGLVAVNA